jgi:hypothetical protein
VDQANCGLNDEPPVIVEVAGLRMRPIMVLAATPNVSIQQYTSSRFYFEWR